MTDHSKEDQALLEQPVLSEQFPIVVGAMVYHAAGAGCHKCGELIPATHLHGTVVRLPDVACIRAASVCPICKTLNSYTYRLHADRRITGLQDGEWHTWQVVPAQTSLWIKLSGWWKSLYKG